jgi:hypothetical protein
MPAICADESMGCLVMKLDTLYDCDLALSPSKGGHGLQACFDEFSTGLQGWLGADARVRSRVPQCRERKP